MDSLSFLAGGFVQEKRTILIVEEEKTVALNMQSDLEALGYAVPETSPSVHDAILSASKRRPDLVIMDVPIQEERNSIQAATLFRTRFDVPVVFLTARTDDATLQRAKETEPYGYLVKPVTRSELRSTIEIVLYKHKMEQERKALQKQLEIANKELAAFNYSVSHDLKTPLQGIQMISKFLLEDHSHQLNEKGKRYLFRIKKATVQIEQIIDGLLALSEVTQSRLRCEPVNLTALAREVVDDLQELDPDRQVTVSIEEGLTINGDSRLLERVLQNLLGNAWKFTRKREGAKIEFGKIIQKEKPVFFIRDNGAGFNMTYKEKLFGAFERLHVATDFEGTGIGLATVQRIIERHNGRIWGEGKEDQGATFYFTIP